MKIRKGLPMPTKNAYPSRGSKFPYATMAVGDAFEYGPIGDGSSDKRRMLNGAYQLSSHWGKRLGAVFTARELDGRVYVWRTA